MSDHIKFSCFKCGQHIEAPSSMRGELLNCPDCDEVNEVKTPNLGEVTTETLGEGSPMLPSATVSPLQSPAEVIPRARTPSQLLIGAGFATASIAALVGFVPFLGWLFAVPLGIAAVIMAGILIARNKIAFGVILLVYSLVGIPLIAFTGSFLLISSAATAEKMAREEATKAVQAAAIIGATRWDRSASTNAMDDVVSIVAKLDAASHSGGLSGQDRTPTLIVRQKSNQPTDVYIWVGQSMNSDDEHLWDATGQIRWNQERPIKMRFGVADSRDSAFIPERARSDFIRNLEAGKRLLVEVPLLGGNAKTMTFTPPAGVSPLDLGALKR